MRTSLTIDTETYNLVKEMAKSQGRTTANLLQHLIRTNNEVVGWRVFKASRHFQSPADEGPVKVSP